MPENTFVITDVGQHQMWAAQRYRSSAPRSFITSGGLGSMGFALPAAVGVQLANPDATVLCISGDGGFQMNIQELATVHRLGLPIKMVIIDNKYLGMVRQWQQLFYQRNYAETDLSDNPNFVAIGYAYGINSRRLRADALTAEESQTSDLLDTFLHSRNPELLVFDCPPEANVFPMVPSGAAISEMMLEEE
jgi:acetolactate synthase-1/2/3 large subunit